MEGRKEEILETIEKQKGLLFAQPSIVYRGNYLGRNLIAPNDSFTNHADERGYVPVERWILSSTPAQNNITKQNEGISFFTYKNDSLKISFPELLSLLSIELFGEKTINWPLIKLLDIGGEPVTPLFTQKKTAKQERPPIPLHVHAGDYNPKNSQSPCCSADSKGKLEAYFYPPLSVPPYNIKESSKLYSRYGLKPGTTEQQVVDAVKHFAQNDDGYKLAHKYELKEYEGWIIRPMILHSPGPYPTIELQFPQDDFNLLSWQLGSQIKEEDKLKSAIEDFCKRGYKTEEELVQNVVDLSANVKNKEQFKEQYWRPSKMIESCKEWDRRRIFFDEFDGECLNLRRGKWEGGKMKRDEVEVLCGGIVWSGRGRVNGNPVDVNEENRNEFLIKSGTDIIVENDSDEELIVFLFFPYQKK